MLRELQQELARALYEEEAESAACASVLERISPLPKLPAKRCLDLYRGSVAQVVHDALGEIFPVCAELVGDDCFRGWISAVNHVSTCATLDDCGGYRFSYRHSNYNGNWLV